MQKIKSNDECDACQRQSNAKQCASVDRIISALKYYTLLNAKNNYEGQSTFINFLQTIYHNYLNDIIHLTTTHAQDLENINKSLCTHYGFKECDLKSCVLSDRHRHDGNINVCAPDRDPMFLFYQNTFDAMHHYLFHLFDLGLRSHSPSNGDDNAQQTKQEQPVPLYFDAVLSRKIKCIQSKRKRLNYFFNRFDVENSKFVMQTEANYNENNSDQTFLDGLFAKIGIRTAETFVLRLFLMDEEYDSVALQLDIEQNVNDKTSNLCTEMKNENLIKKICKYTKLYRLQDMAFSTGFTFWYWPCYAPANTYTDNDPQPIYDNVNDFGGYSVSDLYIASGKWDNFKDEILDHGNTGITIAMYNNVILTKSHQYMVTKRVKRIKAKKASFWKAMRDYNIECGSTISESHIIAIILYCDFSELSAWFSSTFRRLQPLESVESVKQRNKKYYWMSKMLREVVEVYGQTCPDISGPFYTGMTFVAVMPAFSLRLNGPTSTTKQWEISYNFAKKKGIIIQLNNVYYGQQQRFFDVSWISTFFEEDERFTFSGSFALQIESVTNTMTEQNFERFFKPLFYFDCVLCGATRASLNETHELSQTDILILWSLVNRENVNDIDKYIIDTFDMFCLNKQTITINMQWIDTFCPKDVQNMLFHSIKGVDSFNDCQLAKEVNCNILRLQILNLFDNLQNIIIYSTNPIQDTSYPFSIFALSESLKKSESVINGNKIQCIINGVWKDKLKKDGARSWLFDEYSASQKSNSFSLSLRSYKDNSGFFGFYNDALTISLL